MRLFAFLALSQGLLAQNDPAESEPAKAQPAQPAKAKPAQPAKVQPAKIEPDSAGSKRIEEEKAIDNISTKDILPKIAESEFCAAQVQKLCSKKVQKDDYLA